MEHVSTLEQYGPVGAIAAIFAAVIVVLWTEYKKQRNRNEHIVETLTKERGERDTERETFDKERVTLRAEYERKAREQLEGHMKELRTERDESRKHEDEARREFAELIEENTEAISKMSADQVAVLQKFFDRFIGPQARGRY